MKIYLFRFALALMSFGSAMLVIYVGLTVHTVSIFAGVCLIAFLGGLFFAKAKELE